MSKKILKVILCIAGAAAVLVGILYFLKSKKEKSDTEASVQEDNTKPVEETLDAREAIDFSDLKFSRHYVDLR